MTEIFFTFIVSVFFSFLVYWYLKFKYILPIEKKVNFIDKTYIKFQEFSKEISRYNYIPQNLNQFSDFINTILIRFHDFFVNTIIMVFDSDDQAWKLTYSISDEKINFGDKTLFLFSVFNKSVNENDLLFLSDFGVNINTNSFKDALIFPFIAGENKLKKVIFIGLKDNLDFKFILPYIKYMIMHINSFYKMCEKMINIKEENNKLKSELDVMIKELDTAGSRLIKKAKERKALYEIVSKVITEDDVKNGLTAVMSIVARITEANIVTLFVYDESTRSLILNPNVYGFEINKNLDYKISLDNRESILVKSFIEKKPYLINNIDLNNDFMYKFFENTKIKSLIVVPVFVRSDMIGVVQAGSSKENFFTSEHLEFLDIIADELAVIISMINLYERLSKTADELLQMNKIKDEFLATVSHELKTPLTTIKGFVSVMLSGEVGSLTDQQIAFLNIVDQSADRLSSLISNLLDVSKLNSQVEMELSPCNLSEIIRNSISHLYLKAKEKGIIINFNSDKNIPYILGDPHWLTHVSENIISNAIKYSPHNSNVNVNITDRGDVVMVSVEDNGPGIAEDEQKLIFEKFYRGRDVRSIYQGTGLGLAISKSVIEKLGGKIWVESKINKGSKFYFALPKMKGKKEA